MSKQTKLGLAAAAAVAVIVVGAYGFMKPAAAPKPEVKSAQTTATPTATPAAPSTVSYAGVEGKTALELLKARDSSAQTKGEGANAFVTSISGYTASESKKEYWAFYVNGKMSDVGAGSYTTKAGDQIEWKLATY